MLCSAVFSVSQKLFFVLRTIFHDSAFASCVFVSDILSTQFGNYDLLFCFGTPIRCLIPPLQLFLMFLPSFISSDKRFFFSIWQFLAQTENRMSLNGLQSPLRHDGIVIVGCCQRSSCYSLVLHFSVMCVSQFTEWQLSFLGHRSCEL